MRIITIMKYIFYHSGRQPLSIGKYTSALFFLIINYTKFNLLIHFWEMAYLNSIPSIQKVGWYPLTVVCSVIHLLILGISPKQPNDIKDAHY